VAVLFEVAGVFQNVLSKMLRFLTNPINVVRATVNCSSGEMNSPEKIAAKRGLSVKEYLGVIESMSKMIKIKANLKKPQSGVLPKHKATLVWFRIGVKSEKSTLSWKILRQFVAMNQPCFNTWLRLVESNSIETINTPSLLPKEA